MHRRIFRSKAKSLNCWKRREKKVAGGKKATGRPGLDLWHILVLRIVQLALDCDYDR